MSQVCRIAFIGFGEVGSTVAAGLREGADFSASAFDIAQTQTMRDRANATDVELTSSLEDALRDATLVFSAVTTERCVEAAQMAAPFLTPDQIWYDWNSCSPVAKREAAALIEPRGARYTDTAVMSNIPIPRHRVPLLLAGPDARDSVERLNALGMDATWVGDDVGQAATIKMCRSVFLKGLDAVLFESLAAATRAGVYKHVVDSIHETYPELNVPDIVDAKLNRLAQYSERRAGEMREVNVTLDDLGLRPNTPLATSSVLQRIFEAGCPDIADPEQGTLDEIFRRYIRYPAS